MPNTFRQSCSFLRYEMKEKKGEKMRQNMNPADLCFSEDKSFRFLMTFYAAPSLQHVGCIHRKTVERSKVQNESGIMSKIRVEGEKSM